MYISETAGKHRSCNGKFYAQDMSSGGVLLPRILKTGLFCTASVDNIDVSTKSSTALTSLHGTAASINQHPKIGNLGMSRVITTVNALGN